MKSPSRIFIFATILLLTLTLLAAAQSNRMKFTDVTKKAGVAGDNLAGGHGVGWADINCDGLLDFFVANTPSHSFFRNYLFINNGDGTFSEEAAKRGVAGIDDGSHAVVLADIDNDGDYDLIVSNSGLDEGPGQNRIFRNDGQGNFSDVTSKSGLQGHLFRTRGIGVGDFNKDGYLDFIVTNAVANTDDPPNTPLDVKRLYLNNKKGAFTTASNGLKHTGFTNGITVGDINNDGQVDAIESKRADYNYADITHQLWLNGGRAKFSDASNKLGNNFFQDPIGTYGNGSSLGDLDNDGDLDLITVASNYVRVFRNDGNLNFTEVTSSCGITSEAYAAAIGDLDNDGDQDVIIADLYEDYNVFVNEGNFKFTGRPDTGIKPPKFNDPRGIALGDYDDDGDLDVALVHKFARIQLFRNDNNLKSYLKIGLSLPNGQAGGFGCKIWVYPEGKLNDSNALLAYREVSGTTGYLNQNSPEVHVGLTGKKVKVDVKIQFPDGSKSTLLKIPAQSKLSIGF